MNNYFDDLITDVSVKMNAFAQRARDSAPLILCDVEQYSTEAFLLRSFVSLRVDNDGDELALTVNITQPAATGSVFIESDLCMDDGTIVASGPTVEVDVKNSNRAASLSLWSKKFEEFLDKSRPEVMEVLSDMIANREKPVGKPGIV